MLEFCFRNQSQDILIGSPAGLSVESPNIFFRKKTSQICLCFLFLYDCRLQLS